ncbi:MAG: hypothetical protein KM312_04930 [Hydrogenibacillus schlegelii]|uniref:Uncharacterized protein n=1 Tax=Hydrogenibacillus schlegelii TaxID=1484 RepID=A0A947D0T0_HYDSH|nr:hypothetical protein [Hydrogenibacillus schlegelii]
MRELAMIASALSLFTGLIWLRLPPVWILLPLAALGLVFLVLGAGRGRVHAMDIGIIALSLAAALSRWSIDVWSEKGVLLPVSVAGRIFLLVYAALAVVVWFIVWRAIETFRATRRNVQKEEFIVRDDPVREWTKRIARRAVDPLITKIKIKETPPPNEIVIDLGEIVPTTKEHEPRRVREI